MKTKVKPGKTSARRTSAKAANPLPNTFTVRDMNRNTQTVLSAARQHGRVIIRSRDGHRFRVEPVAAEEPPAGPRPDFLERMRQHRERLRALGFVGPKPEDMERLNRIIAGEE